MPRNRFGWLLMLLLPAVLFGQTQVLQGPQGPRGYTGARGPAGTMTINTVTTGAPGSAVIITNTGNPMAAVLNITIPRGSQLFSGTGVPPAATGMNGDWFMRTDTACMYGPKAGGAWPGTCTSTQGPIGNTGATGATGPTGPSGQMSLGTVLTGAPLSTVVISNSGTATAAVWNFSIPRGSQIASGTGTPTGGLDGDYFFRTDTACLYGPRSGGVWPGTCTFIGTNVTVGTTTTVSPSTAASVTNSGTAGAPVFNFSVPRGAATQSGSGVPASGVGNDGDFFFRTDTGCMYGPKAAGAWPGTCTSLVGPQGNSVSAAWGTISGSPSAQTDMMGLFNNRGVLNAANTWTGANNFVGGTVPVIFSENSTDAHLKNTRLGAGHYTNAQLPVYLIGANADVSTNVVNIGGGSSLLNAATQLGFWTASTNTTATGVEQWRIDSSGIFFPVVDATKDLGTTSLRVRNGYFSGTLLSNYLNAIAGFQVNGTALAASHLSNGVSGTGAVALVTNPTFPNTIIIGPGGTNGAMKLVQATGINYFQSGLDFVANSAADLGIGPYGTNATWWDFKATGHLFAHVDNTYDIGASAANRPRNGYFGTSIVAPTHNATTGYQVNGVALSSTHLADSSNLPRLNTSNNFTGGIQLFTANAGLPAGMSGNFGIAGGYTTPIAARMYFGDGSGWKLMMTSRVGGVDTDRFAFFDTGNFTQMGTVHTINDGTITKATSSYFTFNSGIDASGYRVSGTALGAGHLSNGVTGSGAVVLANAPTFTVAPSAPGYNVSGAALNFSHLAGSATAAQVPALSALTGSVTAAQLPVPTSTTLGGVKSMAVVANNWVTGVDATGAHTYSQPGFANLSGSASAAQLPALSSMNGSVTGAQLPVPSASVLGGVKSSTAPANSWQTGIDTTGAPTYSQPGFANLSGSASAAQVPAISSLNGTAGTGQLSLGTRTRTAKATIFDPALTDSGRVMVLDEPYNVTITRVYCAVKTGSTSITINLNKRTEAAIDTAGTDVMAASNCLPAGSTITSFTSASVAAHIPVVLTFTAVTGLPDTLRVSIEYTVDTGQ